MTNQRAVVVHISGPSFSGSGRDARGRMRYWDFHAYLGPIFTDANGNVLKRQPVKENDPAWKPFEAWFADKRAKGEIE
jgi:hypothetical protein